MQLLDVVLLIVLIGFAGFGFAAGLVRAVASLALTIFSVIIASRIYTDVAVWILPESWSSRFLVKMTVFIILSLLLGRLSGVLVNVIQKVFDVVAIIPFTKTLNRILGFVFGLIEGLVVAGSVLALVMYLDKVPDVWKTAVAGGGIVVKLIMLTTGSWIPALFPDVIQNALDYLR